MSTISNEVCLPRASKRQQVRTSIKPLAGLLILALLMALMPARADEVEDAYLQILYVIRQGDDLNAGGKAAPAKAKYQEALKALVAFQRANPDWQPRIVAFRVKSLTEKVTAVAETPAAPAGAAPLPTPPRRPQPGRSSCSIRAPNRARPSGCIRLRTTSRR